MDMRRAGYAFTAILLLDTDTTALALGITPSGVRKLRQRGRLRNYGTSRKALHSWPEVAALVPGLTGEGGVRDYAQGIRVAPEKISEKVS